MKPNFIIICALLFLIIGTNSSCPKDDVLFWEISPESDNRVIQTEVDGIEFKFCLLNEQGEPATVFNEGENFSFRFTMINKGTEPLPFYDYGYYKLDDFLSVKSNKKSFGRPFIFNGYNPTKELRWLRAGKEYSYNFIVPWHDERDEWQLYWGFFESNNREFLSKGEYNTQFSYKFKFGSPNDEPIVKTSLLTFKINFEIK